MADIIKPVLFFTAIFFLLSCDSKPEEDKESKPGISQNQLLEVNEKLVTSEDRQIESYTGRYGWKMEVTGSGLRYMIYRKGNGPVARPGGTVAVNYTLSLLSGDTLETSQDNMPRIIRLGSREVEKGLEEGILMLRVGDRAKFIIPSHLAFGLQGDVGRIPPRATLVYDIELTELK